MTTGLKPMRRWVALTLLLLGCAHGAGGAYAGHYTPQSRADLTVSAPSAEGFDPQLIDALYQHAERLETLFGVLVIANDRLIAEQYFNGAGIDSYNDRMSITKSFTSALVGIGFQQGCLKSLDQKMIEFFPEHAARLRDSRKRLITLRQLLQMRAGYPFEVFEPPYLDLLFTSNDWNWVPHLVDFPLSYSPGTGFGYSNLTAHLVGVIVSRACDTDLQGYAQQHVLDPLGETLPKWHKTTDGYNNGAIGIHVTARAMAKFGLTYLHGGSYGGGQVLPEHWVDASLQRYSEGINWTGRTSSKLGKYFRDIGYGYEWWSATAGEHRVDFAWGHGGNLIVLVERLNLVVVATADPLYDVPQNKSWKYEHQVVDLIGGFVASLPAR